MESSVGVAYSFLERNCNGEPVFLVLLDLWRDKFGETQSRSVGGAFLFCITKLTFALAYRFLGSDAFP